MSFIRTPGLGPIVGHTTDRTCRLWLRAGDPGDDKAILDEDRRTVGVLAVTHKGGKPLAKPAAFYLRLHREWDRTGSLNLGEDATLAQESGANAVFALEPDTEYRVRAGSITIDDPMPNDTMIGDADVVSRLPRPESWIADLGKLEAEKSEAAFRTFPDATKISDSLGFIIGSCRYPGLMWKAKRADRIFRPILDEALGKDTGRPPVRFALMVGDQIYADKLNRLVPIGRADSYAEFQQRYVDAFGSSNMRALLRQLPTYMILDDHEIEDNWSQDRLLRDATSHQLFNIAISAYMNYQWSHGPKSWGKLLYYRFDCGGYPFFVLDTRTQRYIDGNTADLSNNHMLGRPPLSPAEPSQLSRLLSWLAAQQQKKGDIPKFIVSSSVFVPNPMDARGPLPEKQKVDCDTWPAFPSTRRAILESIVRNKIQNVVFLSGDIHCSNIAELTFSGSASRLKAFSVTSSAFYWPFQFADGDPAGYVHDSTKRDQKDSFKVTDKVTMDYVARNFTQEDNFCRLDVDRDAHRLTVHALDYNGRVIEEGPDDGPRQPLIGKLELAPW